MLLLVLTTLESLIIFFIGAVAFFFLGKYFGSRSFTGLQDAHNLLSGEHHNLQKQYKAIQKSISHAENDRNQAQVKMQSLSADFDVYKANDRDNKAKFTELQGEVTTLRSKDIKSKQTIDDLHNRLNTVNDKFRDNQKDTKVWRNEIDELSRSLKDYQQKLQSSQSSNSQLKSKLATFANSDEQLAEMKTTLKGNEKEIKRLTKDCAYWEKQHYDVHHKLASSLDNIEELKGTIVNTTRENKGHLEKQASMQKTLDDIKKKLIYANERYHNMN